MNENLFWRTITPSTSANFLVKGTDLSVAIFGLHSRYAVYEVRVIDAEGFADRRYVVRDADTVSDAALKAGKRPKIVWQTHDYDALLAFVKESVS